MKSFLRKILVFSLIPIIPLLLIEGTILLSKPRIFSEKNIAKHYKQDANNYAWIEQLDNKNINIVAGSSSARYGLSCNELNKLDDYNSMYVNIGMDARGPIQTYFILQNMNLSKVQNLYFGLDPWIYSKRYYKYRNKYLYLDFNLSESLSFYKEHDKGVFVKRYTSLFQFILNFSNTSIDKNLTIPADFGSFALNRKPINFDDLDDWFQLETYGWSDLQFDYLQKIKNLCKSNNINFSLFVPPKRSDYSAFYLEKCKDIHSEYKLKLNQNGINSSIFGKFNLLASDDDSTFFAEAYHLNKDGQVKFSKLFYELSRNSKEDYSEDYSWFTEQKAATHNNVYK